MIEKIDIRQIVTDHLGTLRAPGVDRISVDDLIVFFGIPVLAGLLYLFFASPPPQPAENKIDEILVASFSVFAALLLNIQVFLLGFKVPKFPQDPDVGVEDRALAEAQHGLRERFYRELFANISYAILLSMGLVFLTLIAIFCYLDGGRLIRFVQFVLTMHFALTLLMVMKRVNALFLALRV